MSKPSKEVSCDLDVKKVASQFLSHKNVILRKNPNMLQKLLENS